MGALTLKIMRDSSFCKGLVHSQDSKSDLPSFGTCSTCGITIQFQTKICFWLTFIDKRLTAFLRIKPKFCFENCGLETSTCSNRENNLVLLDLTGLMTKIESRVIFRDFVEKFLTRIWSLLLNYEGFEIWTQYCNIT